MTSEIPGQPLFVLYDNLRKVISLWQQKKGTGMFDVGADERCETKGERCCQQNTTPHRDRPRPSICARNGWIFDTLAFPTREEGKSENVIENERRFLLRRPTFPSEIAVMPS